MVAPHYALYTNAHIMPFQCYVIYMLQNYMFQCKLSLLGILYYCVVVLNMMIMKYMISVCHVSH